MRANMKRRQAKRNRGQGLVEFSLILPVLLFVIFGIIDFGRLMVIYSGISNGAREAVRYGAVPGTVPNTYNYMDCAGMRDRARASVPLMELTDDEIALSYDDGTENPPYDDCPAGSAPEVAQGHRILADISVDVFLITPVINNIWPSVHLRFKAARTIIKEGVQTGPTTTPWPTRSPTETPSP